MSGGANYAGVQRFVTPTWKKCGECGERIAEYIAPGIALWVCEDCLVKRYLPPSPERDRLSNLQQEVDRLRARLAEATAMLEVFAAGARYTEGGGCLYRRTLEGGYATIFGPGHWSNTLTVKDLRAAAELLARWQAEDAHE